MRVGIERCQQSAEMGESVVFLIGVAAYWVPRLHGVGYCSHGRYALAAQVIVLLLLGAAASLIRKERVTVGAAGAGFGLAWIADLVLSVCWPETFHCSHQLLPFEALMTFLVIAIPTRLGSAMALKFTRGWSKEVLRSRGRTVIRALVALAGAVTLLSAILLPLELRMREERALATIAGLARAQLAFRDSHPDKGYSCRISELSGSLGSGRQGKDNDDVWTGGYHYRLRCPGGIAPQSQFTIEASPYCRPDCGNVRYCASQSGVVLALSRGTVPGSDGWSGTCWTDGRVVESVVR